MKQIYTNIVTLLIISSLNAQPLNEDWCQLFDLLSNKIYAKSESFEKTATIHSFGKSNSKQILALDSSGLMNKAKYNTSMLVSFLNDTVKYYIPVKRRTFRNWYNKNYQKQSPLQFKVLVKRHLKKSDIDINCLLTIERISHVSNN